MFGYGFGLLPANFGWGLCCVRLNLCLSSPPLFLAGMLGRVPSCPRSPRTLPLPGGGACGEGLCGGRRGRGLPPPPLFFWSSWLRGGGLLVWFSAPSCCGSVVVAVACFGLGPLVPRFPYPLRSGFVFSFFFCCVRDRVAGGLPLLRRGCAPACPGCFFFRPFSYCVVVVGRCFWLGIFGPGGVVPQRPIGGYRGCCLWCCLAGGMLASVEWVRGFAFVRQSLSFSFFPVERRVCICGWVGLPSVSILGKKFACSSLCLPWAGAGTSLHTLWLTGSLLASREAAGRAPAPCAMWYTHGRVARPVAVGSGSASSAVAPTSFAGSWVRGVGLSRVPAPLQSRFGGGGFNFPVAVCAGAPLAGGGRLYRWACGGL